MMGLFPTPELMEEYMNDDYLNIANGYFHDAWEFIIWKLDSRIISLPTGCF